MRQIATLLYNPSNGMPYMTEAEQPTAEAFREQQGAVAWLYNPWTRAKRDPRDIGTDVLGHLIVPPYEEGEYSGEEIASRRAHQLKLWSYRCYGSEPDKGYTLCSGTHPNRDKLLYLGERLSGEELELLVNEHNRAVGLWHPEVKIAGPGWPEGFDWYVSPTVDLIKKLLHAEQQPDGSYRVFEEHIRDMTLSIAQFMQRLKDSENETTA